MNRIFLASVCVASVVILAACSGGSEPEPTVTVTADIVHPSPTDVEEDDRRAATSSSLRVGRDYAHEIHVDGTNTVISPATISYAQTILLTGPSCDVSDTGLGVPTERAADTYRALASELAEGSEGEGYRTRMAGLMMHNSSRAHADLDAVVEVADSFDLSSVSAPGEELNLVADTWFRTSAEREDVRRGSPLSTEDDVALLLSLHYETTWSHPVSSTTVTYEFRDGRQEPVPALDLGLTTVQEAEEGVIVTLPTTSPDQTYLYYPHPTTEAQTPVDEWHVTSEPFDATVTMPSLAVTSDVDPHVTVLDDGGCVTHYLGAPLTLGSQQASYHLTTSGIDARSLTPPEPMGDTTEVTDNPTDIVVTGPFVLVSEDDRTGWTIRYGIIDDPTKRNS